MRPTPAEKPAVSHFWEQIRSLLLAVLIALGIRSFFVEPFRIPS